MDNKLIEAIVSGSFTQFVETDDIVKAIRNRKINAILELDEKVDTKLKTIKDLGENIIASYKNTKLVLVLGAGVSMDYGLPSWSRLLQRLIVKTLDSQNKNNQERNQVASQLFDLVFGPGALISARYLSNHFKEINKGKKSTPTFEEAIRDSLYEGLDENKESELFRELVKICVSAGKKHRIDSVITYNYDDLLEVHLEKLNLDIPYKPIFKTGQNPETNDFPIYHVHGFLPREVKLTDDYKVTLSDDNYHSQYTDIYRWSNMIQLNKFRDNNCLFIGNSFTDPNQRRLLDIAKEQRGNDNVQHYVIKRKYKTEDVEKLVENVLKIHDDILDEKQKANLGLREIAKFLVDTVHNFETKDANSFGAEIIWIDGFKDIPEIIREVRNELIT